MTDIRRVLTRLGLDKYTDSFIDEGFETWETVLAITESDFDVLGVKLGHRRILQREIAAARGISVEQLAALGSPAQSQFSTESRSHSGEDGRHEDGSSDSQRIKRKYRRHPKPDENAPERPPSAYVIFSNKIREDLKPLNLSFTDIAKRVGESWQVLPSGKKEAYESQATAAKEKYHAEMAAYKMTDSYREYQRYLTEFKAKNSIHSDGKKPRLSQESSPVSKVGHKSSGGTPDSLSSVGDGRHRLGSMGSRSVSSLTSNMSTPTHQSSRGHPSLPSIMPMSIGSPISTSSTASFPRDSSLGPPKHSVEYPPERSAPYNDDISPSPHTHPVEQRSSPSSSTSTLSGGPGLRHPRSKPYADMVPPLIHQASSSSRSSITSSQSTASTTPSSLHPSRSSEDDSKPSILLPPLPSVARFTGHANSAGDHALQRNLASLNESSRPSYLMQHASNPPFSRYPGHLDMAPQNNRIPMEVGAGHKIIGHGSNEHTSPESAADLQSRNAPREGSKIHDPLLVLADAAHAGRMDKHTQPR